VDTYTLQTFAYLNKLSDVTLFLIYSRNCFGNPFIKEEELKKLMDGVPELFKTEGLYKKDLSPEQIEELAKGYEKRMADSFREKLNKSKEVVYNLGLVMLCTIVEMFLDHLLETIFSANPNTLLIISKEKNIALERFFGFKTYEEVLQDFKNKYLNHFNRQGIEIKLQDFQKLGIKLDKIFSWDKFEESVQKSLAGSDQNTLIGVFNKRHSIVHNNLYPIEYLDEVLMMKDFFQKIIINLSIATFEKFKEYGVILDEPAIAGIA
jgi:hypothetical protein